ncbi:MAG: hypothetical protein AB7V46_13805, partial [Thermomicrobiales bacterium]
MRETVRGFTIPPVFKRLAIIILVLTIIVAAAILTASFWINWWWFGSMGYRDSLVIRYSAQIAYTALGAVIC